jgi:hypothetical protein
MKTVNTELFKKFDCHRNYGYFCEEYFQIQAKNEILRIDFACTFNRESNLSLLKSELFRLK